MSIILVAFASVKVAFYSVTLALFSRASGLIWTKYTNRNVRCGSGESSSRTGGAGYGTARDLPSDEHTAGETGCGSRLDRDTAVAYIVGS